MLQPCFGGPSSLRTAHCTLMAFDIVGFGGHRRDDAVRLYLREAMYGVVQSAFNATNVPWQASHCEDRGDGILVIPPPCVPPGPLLEPLAYRLGSGLRSRNHIVGDHAQFQLRMAVHHGPVYFDDYGVAGHAVNHLFRLLEAPEFKEVFTTEAIDFGMVLSHYLYEEVVREGVGTISPAQCRPISVSVKETTGRAWLYLPTSLPWHLPQEMARQGEAVAVDGR